MTMFRPGQICHTATLMITRPYLAQQLQSGPSVSSYGMIGADAVPDLQLTGDMPFCRPEEVASQPFGRDEPVHRPGMGRMAFDARHAAQRFQDAHERRRVQMDALRYDCARMVDEVSLPEQKLEKLDAVAHYLESSPAGISLRADPLLHLEFEHFLLTKADELLELTTGESDANALRVKLAGFVETRWHHQIALERTLLSMKGMTKEGAQRMSQSHLLYAKGALRVFAEGYRENDHKAHRLFLALAALHLFHAQQRSDRSGADVMEDPAAALAAELAYVWVAPDALESWALEEVGRFLQRAENGIMMAPSKKKASAYAAYQSMVQRIFQGLYRYAPELLESAADRWRRCGEAQISSWVRELAREHAQVAEELGLELRNSSFPQTFAPQNIEESILLYLQSVHTAENA